MNRGFATAIIVLLSMAGSICAQSDDRPQSPAGVSATQVGGKYATRLSVAAFILAEAASRAGTWYLAFIR